MSGAGSSSESAGGEARVESGTFLLDRGLSLTLRNIRTVRYCLNAYTSEGSLLAGVTFSIATSSTYLRVFSVSIHKKPLDFIVLS